LFLNVDDKIIISFSLIKLLNKHFFVNQTDLAEHTELLINELKKSITQKLLGLRQ